LIWVYGCGGDGKVKAPVEELPEPPEQESPEVPEQPEIPSAPPGTEEWKVRVIGEVTVRPVLGSDGMIHVGTYAGYVYAISPAGDISWYGDLSESIQRIQALILDADSRMYIGASKRYGSGSYLYALDTEADGEELWHTTASQTSSDIEVVADSEGTIYAGHSGFAPDGTERWCFDAAEVVNAGIVETRDVIYAMRDGRLYSLSSEGTEHWRRTLRGVDSVTLASDGMIYAATLSYATVWLENMSADGVLYAIHPEEGSERWHVNLGGQVRDRNPLTVDEYGTIYVGTYSPAAVVAISSEGTEIWRFDTESGHNRQPMLTLDSGGMLYAAIGVQLYAIYADDGTESWSIEMDGYSAGAAVGPEGMLYFGTSRGYVYAVTR